MPKWKQWFNKFIIPSQPTEIKIKHLAMIMDGNGRWARRRGLPRTAGHQVGLERVKDAVEVCLENGIKYLTLYAFSTENWNRPNEEVGFLMNLFEKTMQNEVAKIHQQKVKIRFLGLKHNLSPSLVNLMEQTEKITANNEALILNIALNYGGRAELVAAMKGIIRAVQKGEISPDLLNENHLSQHLFTAGQPDPDLLIRPGGEHRISNFLIWQMAYTEMYFSELYWPDFDKIEIMKALRDFSRRERRFGQVKEVKSSE